MRDKGLVFDEARRAGRTLQVREDMSWPKLVGLLTLLLGAAVCVFR